MSNCAQRRGGDLDADERAHSAVANNYLPAGARERDYILYAIYTRLRGSRAEADALRGEVWLRHQFL